MRPLSDDGGLEVGDAELPAEVFVGNRTERPVPMKIGLIEWLPRGEPAKVKLELYDDRLEFDAYLDVDAAEQFRDRLDEVLAVIDEEATEVERP